MSRRLALKLISMENLYICIMAGGSGERFWPLSRKNKPKHLLKLFSDKTLLEGTVERVEGLAAKENIFILTNENQRAEIKKIFPDIKIFTEPEKRDTAPAAAFATALAMKKNPHAVLALLPADALVVDKQSFQRQLADAMELACEQDALAAMAINPSFPATGFGYLELGKNLGEGRRGSQRFEVARFVEKPDKATAEKYLESGKYGWNAGIFVWKVESFRGEVERLQPELARFMDAFAKTDDEEKYLKEVFASLPKISVDYAIMEKAKKVVAVKAKFDWDDVGSWTTLPAHLGKDENGNSCRGKVVAHQSKENIVLSQNKVVALCGVKDLVVVETSDAVLVCHKDAVQEVKKLQNLLPSEVI